MKPLRKKEDEGKKRFVANVTYSVTVNYNPQDMPKEYQNAGFYMESAYMSTQQSYKVVARCKEDVEDYIKAYVSENLPLGSTISDVMVEELKD